MALQWDRSLAVGVKFIDEQHQELFARAGQLLEAMMNSRGREEIARLVGFLGAYVVEHFAAEERVMASYRYPDAAAHRAAHAEFVKRFGELKQTFEKDGATTALTIELNRFVAGWLREHIGRTDRALGRFLAEVHAAEVEAG